MALYRSQWQLSMQFLLLLAWHLLVAVRCDVSSNKEIQYTFGDRSVSQTTTKPEAILLPQDTVTETSRRFPGLAKIFHEQLGVYSDAGHYSKSRESSEEKVTQPSQQINVTCTAQCPLCASCPPVQTCPSPCAAIPPCPEPQACPTPCAACPACPTCKKHIPPGYEYFEGHGYYRVHNVPVTWMAAKETCEREGAHLAIINSQDEANLLMSLGDRDSDMGEYFYVGLHDIYKEGRFVTIFGQPSGSTGYTNWYPGEPNNMNGDENCVGMYISSYGPGKLNDINCEKKEPFVCELPV